MAPTPRSAPSQLVAEDVAVVVKEDFLTLYCDPGEDFGWAVACGLTLLARGIEKMWPTVDEIGLWAEDEGHPPFFLDEAFRFDDRPDELYDLPLGRLVVEDFRIYPWKLKALKFNPVRTARAIGGITYISRRYDIPMVLQPAAIKSAAKAAGVEELYDYPLYENRHSNDALQHFVFFTQTELLGAKLEVPNEGVESPE